MIQKYLSKKLFILIVLLNILLLFLLRKFFSNEFYQIAEFFMVSFGLNTGSIIKWNSIHPSSEPLNKVKTPKRLIITITISGIIAALSSLLGVIIYKYL